MWNPNGGEASAPAPASASAGGPPPPPPGPAPKITADDAPSSGSGASDARAGLFAELSKGGAITSGLKKVDKSQMTHKNPALRGSSVVPAAATESKPAASAAPKFGAAAKVGTFGAKPRMRAACHCSKADPGPLPKFFPPCPVPPAPPLPHSCLLPLPPPQPKDPVFELSGKKWVIEHQKNNKSLVIDDCNIKQTVYIYKCENTTIQINGKVNGITLDGCKKTAVVFENCVASFEMVNCQSCQVQVTGAVPTVAIEKTDGAQVRQ